jgi:hypothetical protein
MKKIQILSLAIFMFYIQKTIGQSPIPKSEQYSRTASIVIHAPIEKAFYLFGAWEERKWAPDWNPTPVFPPVEDISKGSIFKTPSHVPGEDSVIWLVSVYDTIAHHIEYVITGSERLVIISILCKPTEDQGTKAIITYTLTGLTERGNHTSRHILEKLFASGLEDWQSAINGYLKTSAP